MFSGLCSKQTQGVYEYTPKRERFESAWIPGIQESLKRGRQPEPQARPEACARNEPSDMIIEAVLFLLSVPRQRKGPRLLHPSQARPDPAAAE
jgi:hypothetical protein